MRVILRAHVQAGVRYELEHRTVRQKTGPAPCEHWMISDDIGPLYAWTAEAPAFAFWSSMFPRALAQQEAA